MRRLVRRLRTDDQGALRSLCELEEFLWRDYYRDHASWLKRALDEVKEAGRAVFGTFSPTLDKGVFSARLDACIFLKPSRYDDSAELKNLVVRRTVAEGDTELASFEDLACPLIEKAIRHCEVREIGKLEIELPQRQHAIVSLFMQLGFRITALRERYITGQYVCVLERTIGERYNADPFDLVKLGKWLLHAILPCKVGDTSFPLEDIPRVPFEVAPSHPAFSPQNPRGYAKRLRGSLIVLDEGDCDEANVQRMLGEGLFGEGQLRYALAYGLTPQSRAVLIENGVTSFDLDEVKEIAGGGRSSLTIPMHRSEVGGVLTVLEAERVTDVAKHTGSFVYYLLSGIGSALVDGGSGNQAGSLLAVFCPNWLNGKSGIVAVAEIEEITNAPFDEAFDCYPSNIPRALTKEDLAFYRTRSDKDRLPVLMCSRLQVFQTPLDIEDGSRISSAGDRAYLKHELEETNSIYISYKTCASLRRYAAQFALPFDGADRGGHADADNDATSRGENMRQVIKEPAPMRILFLSANPVRVPRLDLEQEFRSCERELQSVRFRDAITVINRNATHPDDLVRYVREYKPNVLHFSGHGSKQGIVLRSDTSKYQVVEGASFQRFLEGRGIDLVVLNACYSDVQAQAVQNVVASVIGTTDVVDDEAARRFAVAFYRSLGNGLSVGEAFRDGRDAVGLHGLEDVFQRSGDLDLVLVPERVTSHDQPSPMAPQGT